MSMFKKMTLKPMAGAVLSPRVSMTQAILPRPGFAAVLLATLLATLLPGGAMADKHDKADAAAAKASVRLDDFQRGYDPNETYGQWKPQKIAPFFGSGDTYFFQLVHGEGGEHYVHLKSGKDNSFSFGVEEKFEASEWPMLEWEWKVTKLPKGGDVRVEAKDDQAGSMCLVVNPGLMGFKSLCYLFENDGPKDTPITSTKRENARYLILRTAKEDEVGRWYKEKRNVLEDYIRVYGAPPDDKAVIGMQIDSDSTKSSAEAFYRNIIRYKP